MCQRLRTRSTKNISLSAWRGFTTLTMTAKSIHRTAYGFRVTPVTGIRTQTLCMVVPAHCIWASMVLRWRLSICQTAPSTGARTYARYRRTIVTVCCVIFTGSNNSKMIYDYEQFYC